MNNNISLLGGEFMYRFFDLSSIIICLLCCQSAVKICSDELVKLERYE